jgi:hemerythrin-like domain-containing protein
MSVVIDRLKNEHAAVLARIERDLPGLGDPRTAGGFLDFLEREVVTHFRLEEEALFPELARLAIAAGPLRVMDAEHGAFRALLAAGKAARKRGDGRGLSTAAADLAALLRAHIAKEDGVLFPMALDVLDEEQMRRLDAAVASAS